MNEILRSLEFLSFNSSHSKCNKIPKNNLIDESSYERIFLQISSKKWSPLSRTAVNVRLRLEKRTEWSFSTMLRIDRQLFIRATVLFAVSSCKIAINSWKKSKRSADNRRFFSLERGVFFSCFRATREAAEYIPPGWWQRKFR